MSGSSSSAPRLAWCSFSRVAPFWRSCRALRISPSFSSGCSRSCLVRPCRSFATPIISRCGSASHMVGLSLLLGGWLHREQHYNLQGANAYLGVIVPLVVLSLILPVFTQTVPGPYLSFLQEMFLVIASVGLYCAFLAMQMSRHRGYFTLGD